jgi:glyoxylase I family protein
MSVIQIADLDHVVVRAANMAESLKFYRDVLGCPVERRVERIGLVQLRAGASMVDLIDASDSPPDGTPNMDHFALRLETLDVDALRAYLGSHGIEMGEVRTRVGAKGSGPSVYISDPDGNTVELKGPAI